MFSLGCTFYELVCRKQPPTRTVANKYAFDVQEFLYEVPRQTPKDLVVLVLDMTHLVPMKRPSAKQVLARLAEIQLLLPSPDLSEGSGLTLPASVSDSKLLPIDEEYSSDSSGGGDEMDTHQTLATADESNHVVGLQRATSDSSNLSQLPQHNATAQQVSSTVRKYSVTFKSVGGDVCVEPCWCLVTSSVKPRARKLFVALLSDGMLHFWKSEKKDEFSFLRVLFEQASVVQHTDNPDCLRLSSPVFPGVFWLMEFKTAQIADKWFNAILGVVMRSELNYHSRLKAGLHFGCENVFNQKKIFFFNNINNYKKGALLQRVLVGAAFLFK
jgi:serine/threonine protein kinase